MRFRGILAALGIVFLLTSCTIPGTGPEMQNVIAQEAEAMKAAFFDMNETAQEVPAQYLSVPDDWVTITSMRGVTFQVPPEMHKRERAYQTDSDKFHIEIYTDETADGGKGKKRVMFASENDWSVPATPDDTGDDALKAVCRSLGFEWDGTDASLYDKPLAALGIDTGGTRYGRIHALLSLTEADLAGLDPQNANAIRTAKGISLQTFQNAYLIEREHAHVLIHQYGSGDKKYWVNVMPEDNLEYCTVIEAEDKDTAMRICASAGFSQTS